MDDSYQDSSADKSENECDYVDNLIKKIYFLECKVESFRVNIVYGHDFIVDGSHR